MKSSNDETIIRLRFVKQLLRCAMRKHDCAKRKNELFYLYNPDFSAKNFTLVHDDVYIKFPLRSIASPDLEETSILYSSGHRQLDSVTSTSMANYRPSFSAILIFFYILRSDTR